MISRTATEQYAAPSTPLFSAPRIAMQYRGLVYEGIESAVLVHALPGLPAASHYFPSARTGMLQAHQAIMSGIMEGAPHVGTKDVQIPHMSGVVLDFASMMADSRPFHGTHYDAGRRIESDVFGGHVDL